MNSCYSAVCFFFCFFGVSLRAQTDTCKEHQTKEYASEEAFNKNKDKKGTLLPGKTKPGSYSPVFKQLMRSKVSCK